MLPPNISLAPPELTDACFLCEMYPEASICLRLYFGEGANIKSSAIGTYSLLVLYLFCTLLNLFNAVRTTKKGRGNDNR